MRRQFSLLLLLSVVLFASCGTNKKLLQRSLYFRDLTDSLLQQPVATFEQKLQPGDILYIGVNTPSEAHAKLLNQPNFVAGPSAGGAGSASTGGGPTGYLVENDGTIIYPMLGKLHVAGLTKAQLIDTLTERLRVEIDSPIVSVRLLNYKVTVLGEVGSPGTFTIPNERLTVLDAIGLAGDLTVYGERDSIRVIRTKDGKIETGTLNLNSGNIFNSPYFYLQQNDVVYVKMNKRKIATSDQATLRNISLGLAIISTLTVILTRF